MCHVLDELKNNQKILYIDQIVWYTKTIKSRLWELALSPKGDLDMTVKELMNFLSKFDENQNVVIECDDCEDKWCEIDEDNSFDEDDTLVISVSY